MSARPSFPHTPDSFVTPGSLIGGYSSAQRVPIIEAEAKQHRHLFPDEPVLAGDTYGGKDWRFEFTIGGRGTEIPAGTPARNVGMAYRPRRRIA